jgi:hypothetical protein
MLVIKKMKLWAVNIGLGLMNACYAPALFAEANWFPKVTTADDMTKGNQSAMSVLANNSKKGLMILLFIVSVVLFIKFISTVSHGIEEAKKHEGGSLAVFANYAVMGILYLAMSIAAAYVGYTMINSFSI